MKISEEQTYILRYDSSLTCESIDRAERAGRLGGDFTYDVHVTTVEDPDIQATAKGWRTVKEEEFSEEEKKEGGLFVVEVEPSVPLSRFELPFSHAVMFVQKQRKNGNW